jgi:hypothetical protein
MPFFVRVSTQKIVNIAGVYLAVSAEPGGKSLLTRPEGRVKCELFPLSAAAGGTLSTFAASGW